MNKIATIQTIHSFSEHPNADSLELAKVLGFQVVVKKGQFTHGDKIVFVWPDTICNPAEWNRFLDKNGSGKPIKVKSCKLRGEFSTGLILPLDVLNCPYTGSVIGADGEDVSIILGVEKYIKDDGGTGGKDGETAGDFPSQYVSKTDEMLAQSQPEVHEEFMGEDVYVTLKIDGQSLTFVNYNDEITVCSRNRALQDGDSKFWNNVRNYGLIDKTKGMNIAIQGEQYGPGIQKNPLTVDKLQLAIFNVKNLDTGKYYSYNELVEFCKSKDLPMVPVTHRFKYDEKTSFDIFQQIADGMKYKSNKPAEGIVVRPVVPKYSHALRGMLSVKFINRNYFDM